MIRPLTRLWNWFQPVKPDVTPPEVKRQIDASERENAAYLRVLRNEADLVTRRYRSPNHDTRHIH